MLYRSVSYKPSLDFYDPSSRRVFWRLQVVGWLVYAIAAFWLLLGPEVQPSLSLFLLKLWRSLLGCLAALVVYSVMRPAARFNSTVKAATVGALASIVLGYVWFIAFRMSANLYFHRSFMDWRFFQYSRDSIEQIAILLAWSAVYLAVDHSQRARNERTRADIAETSAQLARWQVLQSQINPHFLFNTLNSIRAAIDESPEQARQMVTHLSDFMRYALVSDDRQLVPLKQELAVVSDYLSIEKARFEDRLQISYAVDDSAKNIPVPRFLLQPLVENAVKHGMATSNVPLRLVVRGGVRENNLHLEIENSGHWASANSADGFGLGLANLRERLQSLYDSDCGLAVCEVNGRVRVSVTIALAPAEREQEAIA